MLPRLSIVFVLLALVLVAPFALRPDPDAGDISLDRAERLVIISPHNESIQSEFGRAFGVHMKREHGREVFVDWRQPGGTSEIARFLKSEYTTRFETLWRRTTGLPFSSAVREGFQNHRLDDTVERGVAEGWIEDWTLLGERGPEELAAAARHLYLGSDIGTGIDLFFGGGAYDFDRQAAAGDLVALDASGRYGPAALAREHPEWFEDGILPASVSGEPFRDPQLRWLGTVLSAFGIVSNRDVLERLGFDGGLERWDDLGDPRLLGQVAMADPTKSGSTTKAFEMLIQERMQRVLSAGGRSEEEAVRDGWDEAMRLVFRISANSRYYTDSAAKVPRDVALGDAAAGMSIDFYGRTFNELYRDSEGRSHVEFVTPAAGTSIGADPIGMLRGAPSPDLAHLFIEFVLSPEGQKLWNYRVGTPGGPVRHALRRPPIRRDFYTEENARQMSDPENDPYAIAEGFTYRPEWTGALFSALRFAIKVSCIDPHEEQRRAWRHLVEAGMPPEGLAAFEDVGPVGYEALTATVAPALARRDKVAEVQLARELAGVFRARYRAIAAGDYAAARANEPKL